MAGPTDFSHAFIAQTTPGTFPATTPAFIPFELVSADFTVNSKMTTSETLKSNRANASTRLTGSDVSGSIAFELQRHPAIDLILANISGAEWATNILKGGNAESLIAYERKGSHEGTAMYHRFRDLKATKFEVTVSAQGNVRGSADFIGIARDGTTAIVTGATYAVPTTGAEMVASDIGAISIGGVSLAYTSLTFTIEQPRAVVPIISNGTAADHITSTGPRVVKATIKALRKNILADTAFTTAPLAVSIPFGTGANNVYTVAIPRARASIPTDEMSGESALISVDLYAETDTALGAEFSITRS